MLDKECFFKPRELVPEKGKDFVADIPLGLTNRQDLFKTLQEKLRLPDYFGYNWDALVECLRDLSWIKQLRVILIHQDIPAITPKEVEEYLDILATTSKYWERSAQHKFLVILPK